MAVRIATFNAENLFRRPQVFGMTDHKERQEVLEDYAELVSLLEKENYAADEDRIAELIRKHGIYKGDKDSTRQFVVNETRGRHTLFNPRPEGNSTAIDIKATGRAAWTGWVELVRDNLDWAAVHNTGRVVAEVDADVLLTVEVEDRLTLERFNTQVLGKALGRRPYPYSMLIDGNDPRGIDIGIFSRHPITTVRSHVFDTNPARADRRLFSRDCPEFEIELDDTPLVVLGNHLKSKADDNPDLRLAQAKRVAEIYRAAQERTPHVVVAGDLNDNPDSEAVAVLRDTDLRDVMDHPAYRGKFSGTHGTCKNEGDKIDYLMVPPPMWPKVQQVGLETRGISAKGIDHFDTVKTRADAASDHAALYADLDL
ncbi:MULTISPECIES: endonuclease/exonuclease/phosphatase family protein [unclassified Streptomyces]|uniref:endonuclease/exonuclease/phosphatase family protein n=1 Tax=unclassified Streptomyces TaxID=2593676 RepID=UPI002366A5CF|nr:MULTISPECIES: endonuclease/exonuclease/phosphatase family protein [unclassified Streptomyces]MDF3141096.1 endonuclease/exonuclease/phosphatase family protein [Streptomyces sp. T21Q-yed]WDF37931.1 endonuclease/exonuclease/phosphatase family protein [Streptomyces sp. T12]